MLKRIHVGLGGTQFTPTAIRYGLELAGAHQANITGSTVIDRRRLAALTKTSESGIDILDEYRRLEMIEHRQERAIADLESACATANINLSVERASGDPFENMISKARYHDLMIFGLRSLFECDFLETDAAEALSQLVSRGVRPILAVSQEYRPIHRVLLAFSGSMESATTIKRFITTQLWSEPSFKVVTFEHPTDVAQILLDDMSAYCQAHGFDVEVEHSPGVPKKQLLQHATDWNADLIVLGSSAKRLWLKKLLGDTTMHVIRHADIPLFLSQ